MASLADDPIKPFIDEIHRRSRLRMLGILLVVSWGVLKLVYGMIVEALGLEGVVDLTTLPVWYPVLPTLSVLLVGLLMVGLSMLLSTTEGFDRLHEMSPKQVALFRGFATLTVVAAVVLSLLFGFPDIRGTIPDLLRYAVTSLYVLVLGTAAIALVLSLALTWRAAEQPHARALALFMAFLALFWGPVLHAVWVGYDSVERAINFGSSWGGNALGGINLAALFLSVAAFLRFSALFPHLLTEADFESSKFRKPLRAIRVKLLNPAIVWGVAGALAINFLWSGGGSGGGERVDTSGVALWVIIWVAASLIFFALIPLVGMAVGAMNLRAGYVTSIESERKKILWVVSGCVGGTCMILAAFASLLVPKVPVLEWTSYFLLLLPFAPLVLVTCLGIAVFYKGEIHPALVIKRATVYGILGVFLIAMFSAAESLLSEVLENALGFSNLASAALLGALIAVLLIPLRRPLSRWVGGWLPSAEGDAPSRDHMTGEPERFQRPMPDAG